MSKAQSINETESVHFIYTSLNVTALRTDPLNGVVPLLQEFKCLFCEGGTSLVKPIPTAVAFYWPVPVILWVILDRGIASTTEAHFHDVGDWSPLKSVCALFLTASFSNCFGRTGHLSIDYGSIYRSGLIMVWIGKGIFN